MDENGANGYVHGQFCQAMEHPITLKVGKGDISQVQLGCIYTCARYSIYCTNSSTMTCELTLAKYLDFRGKCLFGHSTIS